MICVLSANVNQKQCSISFMIAVQFLSGKILNYVSYLSHNSRYIKSEKNNQI